MGDFCARPGCLADVSRVPFGVARGLGQPQLTFYANNRSSVALTETQGVSPGRLVPPSDEPPGSRCDDRGCQKKVRAHNPAAFSRHLHPSTLRKSLPGLSAHQNAQGGLLAGIFEFG